MSWLLIGIVIPRFSPIFFPHFILSECSRLAYNNNILHFLYKKKISIYWSTPALNIRNGLQLEWAADFYQIFPNLSQKKFTEKCNKSQQSK